MSCLPFAANSGHTSATGVVGSMRPRSISIRPASAVTFLVDDQTLTMVSSAHGLVLAASACPPHMSTTVSPPTSMAMAAPTSSPLSIASAEHVGHLVESRVPVSVKDVGHPGYFVPALRMSLRSSCSDAWFLVASWASCVRVPTPSLAKTWARWA